MNTIEKRGYSQLRKGRYSVSGAFYLLTTTTRNREPVLTKDSMAQIIFDAFEWLETKERIRCYCIMIMPDHLHAIIQLRPQHTLPSIMHTLKRFTARRINKLLKQEGVFWQEGYHDSGIRGDAVMKTLSERDLSKQQKIIHIGDVNSRWRHRGWKPLPQRFAVENLSYRTRIEDLLWEGFVSPNFCGWRVWQA